VLYCDLLRMTVLLAAGVATALAAVTVISANEADDTTTLIVAAGWWLIAVIAGLYLGRPERAAEAMRPVLGGARTMPTLPDESPGRIAFARLWPLGGFALVAGGVGVVVPGVVAIGTGYAIAVALAWRSREAVVTGIEDRDGVRFYVEPGSALQPIRLIRTPGLRRDRAPAGHPPPPAAGV
jgi:hypothetical protein